ncbi:hypothetical protein WR25_00028 isoform A [Diploscapter pachys]|nr:hypothetical protein WR25_00028 isoform A [Diploscapter pachys]
MNDVQIRVIILEDGQHLDNVVRKCEKGWIIRFVRGCSLLGKDVTVKTSLTGDSPLQWSDGHDHLSVHCQVECKTAGSFQYNFCVDGGAIPSGSGYFLVMPQLTVNGSALPLDAVSCQTHLVKLLGSLPDWESRLRVAKECGYNMLHLTPIHRLGVSNSSYSIMDHHNLNDTLHSTEKEATFEDVKSLVDKLEKEWNMLTVQDVVWNHAAKNAPWLLEHPECAYNCFNSPHLRPAYVVDRVYHYFGKEVAAGKWEHRGISPVVENVHQTNAIEYIMRTEVLPKIRLHEFFQTTAETAVSKFTQMVAEIGPPTSNSPKEESKKLKFDGNPEWTRFGMRLDLDLAVKLFNKRIEDVDDEEERQKACIEEFTLHLEKLQEEGAAYAWEICLNGLHAVMGGILYERVQDHGPKKGLVDEENPLTTDYFLHLEPESDSWEEDEKLAYDPEKSKMLMAFNGWVMSGNALDNFALPTSEVYLRRELVCWGDSVKLNYGEKPEDASYLWEYMKTYTQKCASMFHGLRIDNAHSTPIHLAEFMLREARRVREDIYVFAELFTGSEQLDNLFVNRLGISSLIREAQSAHDSHEQGRLVYRYGGDCVGAMLQKHSRLAAPAIAHGLFLDQSHDNPSPIQKRTIYDMLPTCAMVSMANCAVGSTRGYDELVRHAIHVVTEKRPYAKWGEQTTERTGIVTARRRLNDLHVWLALNGYSQVFVDQMNEDVVGITRHNPQTHDTVILVARTAFDWGKVHRWTPDLKHFPFGGHLEEVIFEMEFLQLTDQWNEENNQILTGLAGYVINMREHLQPEKARMCKVHGRENGYIELCDFPSGAVIAFKVRMSGDAVDAVKELRNLISGGNEQINKELTSALENTTLQNFNRLLFHCEAEEQAEIGEDAYDIPKFGKFVYCGLQGLKPILDKIRINNDLGHPLCQNLRDGLWLPEYIVKRTAQFEELAQLEREEQARSETVKMRSGSGKTNCVKQHGQGIGRKDERRVSQVLKKVFEPLKDAPYYLRPAYFEALFAYIYRHVKAVLLGKMNPELRDYSSLVRRLTIATVSFMGYIPGADLAPLSDSAVLTDKHPSSLSAGLPHFSTGIWRNWGRDTFIALPGCLLATRRWGDARNIIISFGGSMRHGLIPNLLAEGKGLSFVVFWK